MGRDKRAPPAASFSALSSYLAGNVRVGVHVQLDNADGFPHFGRHLLQLFCHEEAGPTPGRVKIDDHRPVPGLEGDFQGFRGHSLDLKGGERGRREGGRVGVSAAGDV